MLFLKWLIHTLFQMFLVITLEISILLVITWGIHFALLPFGIDTRKLGEEIDEDKRYSTSRTKR
jgi:predicted secreted protein